MRAGKRSLQKDMREVKFMANWNETLFQIKTWLACIQRLLTFLNFLLFALLFTGLPYSLRFCCFVCAVCVVMSFGWESWCCWMTWYALGTRLALIVWEIWALVAFLQPSVFKLSAEKSISSTRTWNHLEELVSAFNVSTSSFSRAPLQYQLCTSSRVHGRFLVSCFHRNAIYCTSKMDKNVGSSWEGSERGFGEWC